MVAKQGGINRVSKHLSIKLQTISYQITLLEIYFGTTLFQKVGRNIKAHRNRTSNIKLYRRNILKMMYHLTDY
jgi:hypothetical protein